MRLLFLLQLFLSFIWGHCSCYAVSIVTLVHGPFFQFLSCQGLYYAIYLRYILSSSVLSFLLLSSLAHWVVSVRDNPVWWGRPRGRPQLSWLEQADESCQDLLRMGRGPAWRLARRSPRVWRRRVVDATRPPKYAPFDCLTDSPLFPVPVRAINILFPSEKEIYCITLQASSLDQKLQVKPV